MLIQISIALIFVLLEGCQATPVPPFTFTFESDVTAEQQAVVYHAAEQWNQAIGYPLFELAPVADADIIHIRVIDHLMKHGKPTIGYTTPKDHYYLVQLVRDSINDGSTVEHELGHTLGLDVSQEPTSVMFWMWTPEASQITPADVAAVREHWGL